MAVAATDGRVPIPRDRHNDYTREAAQQRAQFVVERAGVELEHLTSYSFDRVPPACCARTECSPETGSGCSCRRRGGGA